MAGQLVIYYDPKSRMSVNHEHFPKDVSYAAIHVEEIPEDPDELKAMAEKVARLLLDHIATK